MACHVDAAGSGWLGKVGLHIYRGSLFSHTSGMVRRISSFLFDSAEPDSCWAEGRALPRIGSRDPGMVRSDRAGRWFASLQTSSCYFCVCCKQRWKEMLACSMRWHTLPSSTSKCLFLKIFFFPDEGNIKSVGSLSSLRPIFIYLAAAPRALGDGQRGGGGAREMGHWKGNGGKMSKRKVRGIKHRDRDGALSQPFWYGLIYRISNAHWLTAPGTPARSPRYHLNHWWGCAPTLGDHPHLEMTLCHTSTPLPPSPVQPAGLMKLYLDERCCECIDWSNVTSNLVGI